MCLPTRPPSSRFLVVLAALVLLMGCTRMVVEPEDEAFDCELPEHLGPRVAFVGIAVVDTESGRLRAGQTVVLEEGRIAAVGPADEVDVPASATVIDGCERVLAPGLADMHVHLRRDDLPAYLASGVTTVRNLWGFPDLQRMQAEIQSGALAGPTVYGMSPGLDGTPPKWPLTQLIMDPTDADSLVRAQAVAGWEHLKLYQDLRPDVFEAIIEAAQAQGLSYGGHVPHRVGLERALAAGYRHIEHLSGYEQRLNTSGQLGAFAWRQIDAALIPELVRETVEAGTWNCPTLEIFDLIASGDAAVVQNRRRMVEALFDAGAPLLAGTDAGIGRTVPGVSLHDELAEFEAAGLTPAQVLRIATVEAAHFLDEAETFGQIRAGFRADLLLLEASPLGDLRALAEPSAVIARGALVRAQ